MDEQYDAHVKLTAQVALHEWRHATHQQDCATALQWSLLWYYCTAPWFYHAAEDRFVNEEVRDEH